MSFFFVLGEKEPHSVQKNTTALVYTQCSPKKTIA